MLSLEHSKNATSAALDLIRAVAAQMVCVGHGINILLGGAWPANLPYLQNTGVLLFFIASGFLITHTLIARSSASPDYGFGSFFVDRFARIYSGLIPALAAVILIDGLTIYVTGDQQFGLYYNLRALVSNLLMLESYRGVGEMTLRRAAFGSAAPLWTLAIEWHIYMFVGSIFFMVRRPRSLPYLLPVALFFGQTSLHYLFGALQADGVGRGLFSLWLGGAAIYLSLRAGRIPPRLIAIAAAIGGAALFVALTNAHQEYRMRGYPLLLVFFFGVIAATQSMPPVSPRAHRAIAFAANYSFSLYLVHHTVMASMALFFETSAAVMVLAVALSNLLAIGLAAVGENRHKVFALHLSEWLAKLGQRMLARRQRLDQTIP